MEMISIVRGDTRDVSVSLMKNGQPFVPLLEKVVFTVKKDYEATSPVLIQHEVVDGKVRINHEDTVNLEYGSYVYDVRVFYPDLHEVETPIMGKFKVEKVVNNDLRRN